MGYNILTRRGADREVMKKKIILTGTLVLICVLATTLAACSPYDKPYSYHHSYMINLDERGIKYLEEQGVEIQDLQNSVELSDEILDGYGLDKLEIQDGALVVIYDDGTLETYQVTLGERDEVTPLNEGMYFRFCHSTLFVIGLQEEITGTPGLTVELVFQRD